MKHVKKSVLLWYSAAEMYTLVTAVEDYPQFLPWCERAEVLEQQAAGMTARLHMALAGLHHAFTTRNVHVANESVVVELVDGPFSRLDGHWKFLALSKPAPDGSKACKVELELSYAFSNVGFEAVLSPVFDRVANTLVDSFVKRAEQVYGPR
jgi:ribosome-associated toxin RatA of RatAB toxin-antitoxin module